MRQVALLFGGRSVEHEVSVVSARAVAAGLREAGYECIPIGVAGDGRWLPPDRSRVILEGAAARVDAPADAVTVAVSPGRGLLISEVGRPVEPLPVDVVFPLVHGWGGEDGRLQGAIDLAGLPCVGSGVLGSAAGMDKDFSKRILADRGVPVVPWVVLTRAAYAAEPGAAVRDALERFGCPLFVKPANGGSSVGVARVGQPGELGAAIGGALRHDEKVVIERGIDAREIECAVIGNEHPRASGLGEIFPAAAFYDYASKYEDSRSRLAIPAVLDPALAERIRGLAVDGYRALGLEGFARVDFLVDRRDDRAYLNEVNTLPGCTPISMFPKLWEAAGIPFPRLVSELVELALDRAARQAGRATRRDG